MADRNPAVMSWQLARAMSFGVEVVVTLRARGLPKVRGFVERRVLDGRSTAKFGAEDSNVVAVVAGEAIAVDRMREVALVRGEA